MIIRNWHIGEVASLRDAPEVLTISHRTALRLYGVINIKPLRGFFTANADNQTLNSQFSTAPPTLLVFSFYLLLYHNFSIQNDFMCYDALGRIETQEVVAAGKGADVDFGWVAVDLARQHGLARSIDQFGHALAFHTAYGQSA